MNQVDFGIWCFLVATFVLLMMCALILHASPRAKKYIDYWAGAVIAWGVATSLYTIWFIWSTFVTYILFRS